MALGQTFQNKKGLSKKAYLSIGFEKDDIFMFILYFVIIALCNYKYKRNYKSNYYDI
jgi:hypothetical protein